MSSAVAEQLPSQLELDRRLFRQRQNGRREQGQQPWRPLLRSSFTGDLRSAVAA